MAKIKLTKTAVDAANPKERDYELRDTTIPGFLVKVTPAGRGALKKGNAKAILEVAYIPAYTGHLHAERAGCARKAHLLGRC